MTPALEHYHNYHTQLHDKPAPWNGFLEGEGSCKISILPQRGLNAAPVCPPQHISRHCGLLGTRGHLGVWRKQINRFQIYNLFLRSISVTMNYLSKLILSIRFIFQTFQKKYVKAFWWYTEHFVQCLQTAFTVFQGFFTNGIY